MTNFVRGEDAIPSPHSTLSVVRADQETLPRACSQCPGMSLCRARGADAMVLPERFSLDPAGLQRSVFWVFGLPLAGLVLSAWLAESMAAHPLLQFFFILAILSGVCAIISTQGSRIVALLNLVDRSSTGYAQAQHHLGKLK